MKGHVTLLPEQVPFSTFIDDELAQHGYLVLSGPFRTHAPLWHRHRGVEILFIHSGTAEVFSDGWNGTLLAGEASLSSAHGPHGASGNFSRTVIHFVPELVQGNARDVVDSVLHSSTMFTFTLGPDAVRRLLWVGGELQHIRMYGGHNESVRALLALVAAEISVALENPAQPSRDLLRQVISYMRADLKGEETLDALCRRFDCSRSHLFQLFRDQTGHTPGQYWLKLRMEHACHLLDGPMSIEEIADAVGFQSLRGFQRAFRRHYGMPPSRYRALLNKPSVF